MAKQCIACKKKIGLLSTGYEFGQGCILCYDCNTKITTMRTTLSDEEFDKAHLYLMTSINNPADYPELTTLFENLKASHERKKIKHKELMKKKEEEKLQRFGGSLPIYEFSTTCGGLGGSYTNTVYVFENRITICRAGNHAVHNLPAELTIYYKDALSVSFADDYGRARITLTVPGMASGTSGSAMSIGHGIAVGGSSVNYFDDPCTIVFGMNQGETAKKHYEEIRKYFYASKSAENSKHQNTATIQQDTAVDKLKKLKELKDLGIISEDEYESKRKKLLSEI